MYDKLKVIDWNISYMGDTQRKIDFLSSILEDNYCVLLQEVKRNAYDYLRSKFPNNKIIYSLDYRTPSRFDSNARKLGVVIILSSNISVIESGVIERAIFPERTLYTTVAIENKIIKILALHSITGCSYLKAKSVQFDSFAEFIDSYKPDIVGVDANEPKCDSNNIYKMEFYKNGGDGAKKFFIQLIDSKLNDTFVKCNNISAYKQGEPLTVSHKIRGIKPVRYDFLFTNNSYRVENCKYLYEEAIDATSDHALIIADLQLNINI